MTEMSKEDMVKEAVEEAKAKAGQEETSDQEETTQAEENTEAAAEDPEDPKKEPETEESGSEDAESGETKEEKKKLFGKKNKKDKKDEKIEELTDRLTRQMAEFDNFRKRTEKEKSQMYEIGAEVIKLCHLTGKTIGQFLDLFILFVFLVLLSEKFLFLCL